MNSQNEQISSFKLLYIKLPYLQLQIKMTFHPTTILFNESFLEILYNFSSSYLKKTILLLFRQWEPVRSQREPSCQDCYLQYDTLRGKWGWILLRKFSETVPTHNKHIFVRAKRCAYYEKSAHLGKSVYFGKWRISHLRYSLYRKHSSIRIGLSVYNVRKKFLTYKNVF